MGGMALSKDSDLNRLYDIWEKSIIVSKEWGNHLTVNLNRV